MIALKTYSRTGVSVTQFVRLLTLILVLSGPLVRVAAATELGASVYPVGVETVLPGLAPAPGTSMFYEFNNFYQANTIADGDGRSAVPGFHLRVGAVAVKFTHNWGVHVLGGTLVSYAALPYLYEHLDGPFGKGEKSGFSNPDIQPMAVAYGRGAWHWWYGFDVFTPGFAYQKNDLVNIGQHNFAVAPTGALSYLPGHKSELSLKLQYITNGENTQTKYRSGSEFIWEYDAMRNLTRRIAVGVNGFYYQQTTDDRQFGAQVGDGNRGRDLAAGPEIRCHWGRLALIAKYQRDTLVRYRPIGNSFWLQVGVPIGKGE